MTDARARFQAAALAAAVAGTLAVAAGADGPPSSDLVGRWRGTSICTKADWNQACHDETAFYEFAAGDKPGHVLLHAYKIVEGKPEFMGDLDVTYDEAAKTWAGENAGTRVRSRWTFDVHGDELDGRAVFLPSMRVGRTIHLKRER